MGRSSGKKAHGRNVARQNQPVGIDAKGAIVVFGKSFMPRALAEIKKENMVWPRLLVSDKGDYFVYDLRRGGEDSVIHSLMQRLIARFGSFDRVPSGLVDLLLEEPWEQAYRGRSMRLSDVIYLYSIFGKDFVEAGAAFAKAEQKSLEGRAMLEAKRLSEAVQIPERRCGRRL